MLRNPYPSYSANYHPSRLEKRNDSVEDKRWRFANRGFQGDFNRAGVVARQLFNIGHHDLHMWPEQQQAATADYNPVTGGALRHRKPWQIKGSKAAKAHMAKLRTMRRR